MNEAIAFDTHRFVKHLTGTGFTEQQAMLLNINLATKADIAQVEVAIARLKVDIAQVEATHKVDVAQAKQDLTKWMAGIAIVGIAVLQTMLIVGLLSWLLPGR